MQKSDVTFYFSRRNNQVSHIVEGNEVAWQEGQAFECNPRAEEAIIYWFYGEIGLSICLLEAPLSVVQLI